LGIATTSANFPLVVEGGIYSQEITNSAAATININWYTGIQQRVTLNQAGHTVNFSNGRPGATHRLVLCQDGTGSRTVTTWPSTVRWSGGTAPTLTTTVGRCDVISFIVTNGTSTQIFLGVSTTNF